MINTTTVLAMRCPECGNIEYASISLFSFVQSRSLIVNCSCGFELAKIITKRKTDFWIQYNCIMCEGKHLLKLSRKQMWLKQRSVALFCDDIAMDVGYIGPKQQVTECINNQEKSVDEIVEKLGLTDFFNNSDIMYEILESVYDVVENGNLFCSCGSFNIEVEIFPGYIELSCEVCKSKGKIMAESEEDLNMVRNLTEVKISRKGCIFKHVEDYNNRKY